MRPGFSNLLYATLFLSIGLGAGWWLRGAPEPAPLPSAPANSESRDHSMAAAPDQKPTPEWHQQAAPPPKRRYAESHSDQLEPAAPTDSGAALEDVDLEKEFRALLAAQAFTAAMDLYQEVERGRGDFASQLKGLVLEQLEHYLRIGDAGALTALVDAFLSVYYDDIDVLLVLARYQRESGYIFEAARSFQLAFAYSQAQAAERHQVGSALRSFVKDVDLSLAGQSQ